MHVIIFREMLIQEKALNHWINHFYGYGSWDARIWFIGYEESGGDVPEDVAERLNYFTSHHPASEATLCDIRELYKSVAARLEGPRAAKFTTLFDHRFGKQAVQHGGWKNLIAFAFGYENKKLPDLLNYQRKNFAAGVREALINLYPLPAPHNHAWYYSWVDIPGLEFIRSRSMYQDHLLDTRLRSILQNIKRYSPEVVVMYGMSNINTLKKSVQGFFPGASFTASKAIWQHIPQYHRADIEKTTLLITTQVPTLRHNRVETGFDWYAFGKSIA